MRPGTWGKSGRLGKSLVLGKKFSSDVTGDGPTNPNTTEIIHQKLNEIKEIPGLSFEQMARVSNIAIQEFNQEMTETEPRADKWLQTIAGYSLSQLQNKILLLDIDIGLSKMVGDVINSQGVRFFAFDNDNSCL